MLVAHDCDGACGNVHSLW